MVLTDLLPLSVRKRPIFNTAFAISNSNAKTRPEIKFLLTIFKFVFGYYDDNRDNDLRLYFKR
jgi:hypothetical protein